MKKLTAAILTLAILSISITGCGGGKKEYTCPNFTVYDKNMRSVELEDLIGEPIVLNFWASWCYYCTLEMPDFENAYRDYPNVKFMMINNTDGESETVESANEYIDRFGYTFPVYYDITLEAAEKYSIDAFPITYFIDKNGDIVKQHRGMISDELLREYLSMISEEE